MRTSDETIRELERLNAARTQGEWYIDGGGVESDTWSICDNDWEYDAPDYTPAEVAEAKAKDEANRQTIVAAVNALPNLLAALRARIAELERERDEATTELSNWARRAGRAEQERDALRAENERLVKAALANAQETRE